MFDEPQDWNGYFQSLSEDQEIPVEGGPKKQSGIDNYTSFFESLPEESGHQVTGSEKAQEMIDQATKSGRIPSTNFVKDLIKKYTDPEYTARADTAEHFKKTVSNLAKSAKGLIPGLVTLADKTVGAISRPGHAVMERGMEQAAAKKAQEMGMEPSQISTESEGSPLKNMADLALWPSKLIADVIKDPIGTVENRPLDIVMLAAGGALHKGAKKVGEAKQPIPDVAGVIPKEQIVKPSGISGEFKGGPGEVRGLGIEFVDDAGRPISRAEAFRGRQNRIEPTGEPGGAKVVISPVPLAEDHITIVQNAIKAAKPIRKGQEALYHAELQKRFARVAEKGKTIPGEAGFHAMLGELKGPLPKAEFEPIKIPQENVDGLFQMIKDHPELSWGDKVSTGEGLAKLFGEFGGEVPQPKQLVMLEKVFGPEFVKTVSDKTPWFKRMKSLGIEIANIPRAYMASCDLSFGLRQGVVIAATHPAIFWKNFPKQFKWFASEKAFNVSNAEIASRPTFDLMNESGLSLTNMGKQMIGREEPFQSPLAEKIPIAGHIVKASNRAYSGFANKLRADTFDYLIKRAETAGRDPRTDIGLAKDIATVVNTGSGRGSLGKFERAGPALNAFFFSPKLMASRLQMLNPMYYVKLDKFARVEALRQLVSTAGAGITIMGLAKMAGAKVGTDWRSADFGKIRVGNTRFDIGGGFLQYFRLFGQLWTGKVVSSTTGKVSTLGEGYKPRTRLDILTSAIQYKEAPVVSFATSLLKGQEAFGGDFKLSSEIAKRFIPLVIQDLVDIYKDDPTILPIGALGIFGVGLQTYSPSAYRKRHGTRTSLQ